MAIKDTFINTHCGTKQADRLPKAIADDYIRIDERTLEDLTAQMERFASQVTFHDGSGESLTWQSFFNVDADMLQQQMKEGSVAPHMALLLSFLKLYGKEQEQLNMLLRRHRDFYYKEVLGFEPRKGSIGTVPVCFQLKKSTSSVFIPKGTLFDAGKDAEARPIYYATTEDVTLNKAKVTSCKQFSDGKIYDIAMSEDVSLKTSSALDKNLGNSSLHTLAKGNVSTSTDIHHVYLSLPNIEKADGNISIQCSKTVSFQKAEYTTADGWTEFDNNPKAFPLSINADKPHFAPYDNKVHEGKLGFNTPLVRLTCNTVYEVMNAVEGIKSLTFHLTDSENLAITNNLGIVANTMGAKPFGTLCQKGDLFIVTFPFIVRENSMVFGKASTSTPNAQINIKLQSNNTDVEYAIALSSKLPTSCIVKLNDDKYDQTKFPLNFAKYIASQMKGSKLKPTEHAEPTQYSILELKTPIKAAYSFQIENIQKCVITPQQGEVPTSQGNILSPNGKPLQKNDDTGKALQKSEQVNAFFMKGNTIETLFKKDDHFKTELYFHLSGMDKAGPLSMYFQFNPFNKSNVHVAQWSYHDGNNWIALPTTSVVKDTTDGLCRSGIVVLNFDADKVEWFKASFIGNYTFNLVQPIQTQVAELEFDRAASPGTPPVGLPLPAGTITKPKTTIPGIQTVKQPFEGKRADYDETEEQFACRVSEKLRHKGRAWTAWDYERLVLERFPSIASVQCYPAYDKNYCLTPGSVLLVVIPQLSAFTQENPLKPKVETTMIRDIELFLKDKCPAHVTVFVQNPKYEEIKTTCTISLPSGCIDKEHYSALLCSELTAFLAPWTASGKNDIDNKRMLNESDIAAFIQQQPYVDKIWTLQVNIDGREVFQGTDIRPSDIGILLTSAENHEITIVSNDKF